MGWPTLAGRYCVVLSALGMAAALLLFGPVLTDDGPMHVAFAQKLLHGIAPGSLQATFYEINYKLTPNWGSELVLVPLMLLLSPETSEAVLQLLAISLFVLSALIAARSIDPGAEALGLVAMPLALSKPFFLGLNSFMLSMAGFLFAVALLNRLLRQPRGVTAALLLAVMVVTYAAHSMGFIMALVFIGGGIGAGWLGWLRGLAVNRRALLQGSAVCGCAALLMIWPLLVESGHPVELGWTPWARLSGIVKMYDMAVNLVSPLALAIAGVATVLLLLAAILPRLAIERQAFFETRLPLLGGCAAVTALALVFPNVAGGGGTHMLRTLLVPPLALMLIAASCRPSRWVLTGTLAVTLAITTLQVQAAAAVQVQARRDEAMLRELGQLVGNHCTLLPVMLDPFVGGIGPDMLYEPHYHAASRLELSGDRVVLFNFLTRLGIYPIRYRSDAVNPVTHAFEWQADRQLNTIDTIDIAAFERSAATRVDYVLVRERLGQDQRASLAGFRADLDRRFGPVAARGAGAFRLYRSRITNPRCTAPAVPASVSA